MPTIVPILSLVALLASMGALWARQRRTGNAGEVDVAWAAGVGAVAVAYAAFGSGWGPRRALYGVLCGLWSLRLAVHLGRRVIGEAEDGRYAEMRRQLGERFDRWMVGFFALQALLAWALAAPLWVLSRTPEPGWRVWDALALGLWLVSVAGEAIADRQLAAWKRDPANRGRTCRSGLWRWSRHPNYFFEWLHWGVYPLAAVGLPLGWTLWLAPLAMLVLITRVTGIPPTEAQSVRSRGEDYRAYQRTTSAFFPAPPRRDPEPHGSHSATR